MNVFKSILNCLPLLAILDLSKKMIVGFTNKKVQSQKKTQTLVFSFFAQTGRNSLLLVG